MGDGKTVRKIIKIGLIFGVVLLAMATKNGLTEQVFPDQSPSKPCYRDAISAYDAMIKAQKLAKKQAGRININTATAGDFANLQGVGMATAERIVKYRMQAGGFVSVDELQNVKGVGKAVLDKNRHRLSVID